MEHTLVHLAESAAWFFVIWFILGIIGIVAIVRWIVGLLMKGERAVETGVQEIERKL